VGIVGRSGAGKSSFVGLLLGLHTPAQGVVLIDGRTLEPREIESLRRKVAWIDPSVQLWNRSLLENVLYGSEERAVRPLEEVVELAELKQFVERLPKGLQSPLGEGGATVSGGEGQRVRLARALAGADAKLVILDEAF